MVKNVIHRNIYLAQDTIEKNELYDLCEWIKQDNRLTKGELTLRFEKKFAEYMGSKHAVFVNSGSSANLLMVYSLLESGLLKNKKVIAPAVSWVTTVSPLMHFGFDIQLCDCDENNLGLNIEHFEKLCKEHKPALVIMVNVLGHINSIDRISELCEKYGVILLEDSCEALGSLYKGKKSGAFGEMGSFSFYYGHHISTIEGGMVVTNNTTLYNIMLSLRSHGWGRDVSGEYHNEWKKEYNIDDMRDLYTFYYPGFNLRSTDLNAFLGISQIEKIDQISLKRQENFNYYKTRMSGFWCQESMADVISSFAFGTIVKNRIDVYQHLKKHGIESRPLVCGNIGRHPFWIKRYGEVNFEMADIIHDYGLYLPNHFGLGKTDIDYIASRFKDVAIPYSE